MSQNRPGAVAAELSESSSGQAGDEQRALAMYLAGDVSGALEMLLPMLRAAPARYDLWNFAGVVYRALNQPEAALAAYRKALNLGPRFADTHSNLANLLRSEGELEAAADAYREAVALRGDFVAAHIGLGGVLRDLGRLDEAMVYLRQAMTLEPDNADAHWDYALTLLTAGRYREGFAEYEWRWQRRQPAPPNFTQPPWRGEHVAGQTVFIYTEQGLGDFIQYLRFLPAVLARVGRVVMDVFPALMPIIPAHPSLQLVVRGGSVPPFDSHCALMSLPQVLGYDVADVHVGTPYVHVPANALARWRARLGAAPRLRVGVVWAGNPSHKADHIRSMHFSALAPLFARASVDFFVLQVGAGRRELEGSVLPVNVMDVGADINDFADTAAIMRLVDVVITPDTSTAHLAGALGVPVWVLLPQPVDWRWMLARTDSPWYVSARLFRQTVRGDWTDVIARVGGALDAWPDRRGESAGTASEFKAALAAVQAGDVALGGRLCDALLAHDAACTSAWVLRGAVYARERQPALAEQAYRRALTLAPNDADAWLHLGHWLRAQQWTDDAIAAYRHVVEHRSDVAEPWVLLCDVLRETGDVAGAVDAGRRAVELGPHLVAAWNNLGAALARNNEPQAALTALRRGLALAPAYVPCLINAAGQLEKLGMADEAVTMARRAFAAAPHDASAYRLAARNLRTLGRLDEAYEVMDRCLRERPDDPEGRELMAAICNDRGTQFFNQCRHDLSLAAMREAVHWQPLWPVAHYNLALLLLQHGLYEEGWREYEWRLKLPQIPPHAAQRPVWDGSDIAGKTLLLHWEQGFGDVMLFLRFAPLVAARGARIVLEVQPALKALCAALPWVTQVVSLGDAYPADIDYKCSLLSLPQRLGITFDTLPTMVPYLVAPPERVARWQERLGPRTRPRVGMVWAGSPTSAIERVRAPGLEALSRLWRYDDVDFVIIQKGAGRAALERLTLPANVRDVGEALEDFADTAAVMSLLDAMISSDTSTAHLAGALGLPLWVPLQSTSAWPWVERNGRCYWYPTAKLFRQTALADWTGPVEALSAHLAAWRGTVRP